MAITFNTKPSHIFSVIGNAFYSAVTFVAELFNGVTVAFEKHQTRKALYNLTSRELEDIGISRAEITGVVDKIFKSKD